jgi:hypothetical protein
VSKSGEITITCQVEMFQTEQYEDYTIEFSCAKMPMVHEYEYSFYTQWHTTNVVNEMTAHTLHIVFVE